VNRHAYTFCVLEQFWRHLKRRDIYADASTEWRNPQARLLEGGAWEAIRSDVLTTLGLPENPGALLAEHAQTLDAAYREAGGRLAVNTEVRVDDAGKIHLTGVKAVEEPPSLVDLGLAEARGWSAATATGVFYGLKAVLDAMAYAIAARNLLSSPAGQA